MLTDEELAALDWTLADATGPLARLLADLRTYRAALAVLAEERLRYQISCPAAPDDRADEVALVDAIDNCLAACGLDIMPRLAAAKEG